MFLRRYFLYHKNPTQATARYGAAKRYKIPSFNPLPCVLPFFTEFSAFRVHMEHCADTSATIKLKKTKMKITDNRWIAFISQIYENSLNLGYCGELKNQILHYRKDG